MVLRSSRGRPLTARTPRSKTARKQTIALRTGSNIGRNVQLYGWAYRIAWSRISPLQKSEQPNLPLWLHASIRRQLKGARDPFSMAFEALKALAEREVTAERSRP
jgi:hypothetical protein